VVVFAQDRSDSLNRGREADGRIIHHRRESDPVRMKMAKQMGADVVLDPKQVTSSKK
jgi:hypothetical protein